MEKEENISPIEGGINVCEEGRRRSLDQKKNSKQRSRESAITVMNRRKGNKERKGYMFLSLGDF